MPHEQRRRAIPNNCVKSAFAEASVPEAVRIEVSENESLILFGLPSDICCCFFGLVPASSARSLSFQQRSSLPFRQPERQSIPLRAGNARLLAPLLRCLGRLRNGEGTEGGGQPFAIFSFREVLRNRT